MKIFSLLGAFLFLLLGILACSEGDVSFDTDDAEVVTVKAYMMLLGDSAGTRLKSDTLLPSDSLVLIAQIEPSRSIRISQFYWQIDSSSKHSEFSYRTNVSTPGLHQAKFILLDRFEDTLQDSVSFWIAPEPVLDTGALIPKNGTTSIPTSKALSFAWKSTVENPLSITHYPFLLKCGSDTLVDTVLNSTEFIYTQGFPTLTRCSWTVSAHDNFGRTSPTSIRAAFFTENDSEEVFGAAFASISTPFSSLLDSLRFKLFDADGNLLDLDNFAVDRNDSVITLSKLPAADYRLFVTHFKYTDFTSDTLHFTVRTGKVSSLGTILLSDTVQPQIICDFCTEDSLTWNDTLRFAVEEKGLPPQSATLRITFDGATLSNWDYKEDSLFIYTHSLQKSFAWHPLKIALSDRSGNYIAKNFYVEPGKSCVKTLDKASIFADSSISIPIQNLCPNLTPKRYFWDIDNDGNWDGEAPAAGPDSVSKTFSGSLFHVYQNPIRVYILYESGAQYEATFTLYVDGVSG